MLRTVIIIISLMVVAAGLGCAALSHLVTPAEIDRDALRYAVEAGVADYNDYDAWYPNLDEATRLPKDVDAAHSVIQLDLQQQIQKDDLDYSIHTKTTTSNLTIAQQREEQLFGETGLLSLGLSILGAGGAAGLLGLSRKRPGDITKPGMEQALATATRKSSADLSLKEKQFVQLVRGVQAFTETYKGTTDNSTAVILQTLKRELNGALDKDTQAAVAVVKITV